MARHSSALGLAQQRDRAVEHDRISDLGFRRRIAAAQLRRATWSQLETRRERDRGFDSCAFGVVTGFGVYIPVRTVLRDMRRMRSAQPGGRRIHRGLPLGLPLRGAGRAFSTSAASRALGRAGIERRMRVVLDAELDRLREFRAEGFRRDLSAKSIPAVTPPPVMTCRR